MMAVLCFFHVMVYWINFHHFLRFSGEYFTIAQSWVVIFMSLGLIFYPISLTGWIEDNNHLFYGMVNCFLTLLLVVLNRITPSQGGNQLYRIYRGMAPSVAFLWYLTVGGALVPRRQRSLDDLGRAVLLHRAARRRRGSCSRTSVIVKQIQPFPSCAILSS